MSDSSKDIKEKEKIYHKKTKAKYPIIMAACIVMVYAFFFTSQLTLPEHISDRNLTTKIGQENDFSENRSYTLVSAKYSEEQKVMEVILNLQNENYDNVNDYYYALTSVGEDSSDIKINEVYNEDLFTVVRFENLDPSFREINFMIAPKTVNDIAEVKDEDTASIILNKYNISDVQHIDLDKTKTEYAIERLEGMVGTLNERLDRQKEKLQELNTQLQALKDEESLLNEESKYMTDSEVEERKEHIQQNDNLQAEIEQEIVKQENKIKNTEAEIANAKSTIDSLK